MKICLFDSNLYKFTNELMAKWREEGHEVQATLYYDPAMAKWADVIWFDTCDNSLKVATTTDEAGWNLREFKRPDQKVIVRAIDIEIWAGHHMPIDWSLVDDVIFLAPHLQKKVTADLAGQNLRTGRQHLIPCGVDMNKFTFRKEPVNTHRIAWVAERWHAKGIDLMLQLAIKLKKWSPEFEIHACGVWAVEAWYRAYVDYFIKQNNLDNIFFIDRAEDMNEWLEDKSHVITASKKEAFSYATGEGMAKGCKPLIHDFLGARDLWDGKYVWDSVDEAFFMAVDEVNYYPEEYREYIGEKYSFDLMYKRIMEVINVYS